MQLKNWLKVIVIPILIALTLYYFVFPVIENQQKSDLSDRLVGTWESKSKNVTITFYKDKTYMSNNNGTIYSGQYKITNTLGNYINLNWEGYNTDYMALFEDEQTLRLVGVNAPSGYIVLSKI